MKTVGASSASVVFTVMSLSAQVIAYGRLEVFPAFLTAVMCGMAGFSIFVLIGGD